MAHSGVLPHLPQLDGTDSHLYLGWYLGDERDFPTLAARWPRLVRFVTEFGAQAVPDDDDFMEAERWPDLDWPRLAQHHALQKVGFDRYVPPAEFATYDEWKSETQAYQARVIRYHIETLRRLKYRPAGGLRPVLLRRQLTGGDLVGARPRAPPQARATTRCARPAGRSSSWPTGRPEHVHPGDRLDLDLHAINDTSISYRDIIVDAHLSYGTERRHVWSWQGDLPSDSCVRVGTIDIDVPDIDEPLVLDLELHAAPLDAASTGPTAGRRARHQPLRHLGPRRRPRALSAARRAGSHPRFAAG